jgi:signal-transduction protein with cAMP-binding, CBS, and nucleotidyltransferase domain
LAADRPALALFLGTAGDAMRPAPVLSASTSLADALAAMAAGNASAVLAVDPDGRLVGLLTERDVVTRVAFRADPLAPLASAATPSPSAVGPEAHLYRVIARMQRRGWRHMPVVDAGGRPLGVVARAGALAAAGARVLRELDVLGGLEDGLDDHRAAKRAQAALAQALLDDGLPAPDIQRVVTEINRDIHRSVLRACLAAAGEPPVPFTVLLMGSGGRGESFLSPDQDHGFVIADYPDADHDRIDGWFADLGARFAEALDAVGFPLCKGNVMASNPLWRKTATQWRDQLEIWIARRTQAALLFADIFFDFEPIWGDPAPALALRAHVAGLLKRHPGFAQAMLGEDRRLHVALGFLGRLATQGSGEHAGEVDLKLNGTMPLVAAARLQALARGIVATGTRARLAVLAQLGALKPDEGAALDAAFATVTGILLRGQLADASAGREPDSYVRPDELAKGERAALVEALRAIDAFLTRTRADFTGRLLG